MAIEYRIMTVCTGNICRSPMAEVVLRERLARAGMGEAVSVDSSGVSGEESGNPIDPRARVALAASGYPTPRHRARQVRPADLRERDLVLAATAAHGRRLRALLEGPGGPASPTAGSATGQAALGLPVPEVALIRAFDPAAGTDLDLDDPWYGNLRDFELCLRQIEAAADGVVGHVRAMLGRAAVVSPFGSAALPAD